MKYYQMATMALMVALLMTVATAVSSSAQTVTASSEATYSGLPMNGVRTATQPAGQSVFAGAKPLQSLQPLLSTSPKMIHHRTPEGANAKPGNGLGAPLAPHTPLLESATPVSGLAPNAPNALLSNFDGLSDTKNKAITGFHDTPPDQGLCVGNLDGFGGKVVIEVVNSIFGIYTPGGTLLSAFNVTIGFGDPNAFSDPVCVYDAATSSFYMSLISFDLAGNSVDDVLVVNRSGFATTYQFPTSIGGTCFGDQPHLGFDNNNVYVATDEFCGPGQNTYSGALLIAISKSQLAAQGATPNSVSFGPLSLGGIPILTLQPARSPGVDQEYLLNAFPYDQFGNSNSVSNSLGLWSVSGEENVTTGGGPVTLTGQIIPSEPYAFPMPAASTGDGTTPAGSPNFVISEPFLNPDDSRMLQVQAVGPNKKIVLWAALSSAVNIVGDPSARDGVAWFQIDTKKQNISEQGYVASIGQYLLYPAILHSGDGSTLLAFSITSPTLNPSAAYAVMDKKSFGSIQIAATGTGAHVSFSDILFGQARWGDYSAATLDLNGNNVWMATEYIGPPPGGADLIDNWGTRVFLH